MMKADTLDLASLAIQLETAFTAYFYGADSCLDLLGVEQIMLAFDNFCLYLI